MSIYYDIYYTLVSRNVHKKDLWESPESELHRHHIVPKHSGGKDEDSNYTYLSIREHIIAHFLLWKINKNPNDLRSMNMLGGRLSKEQRRIVGKWCFENKIGMHGEDAVTKAQWSKKGAMNQVRNKIGIHDPKNHRKNASLGGKASMLSPNSKFAFWASDEGRSVRGRMGAEAIKGRVAMHKPGTPSFKRIKKDDVQSYIESGYVLGVGPDIWAKRRVTASGI